MKNIFKKQDGVTLIESLVAMAIVVTGLVAMISLALVSLTRARISKEQIVATTLVREGVEIVRTIRDTNWLRNIDCWSVDLDADLEPDYCGLIDGLYAFDYTHADGIDGAYSGDGNIEDFDFAEEPNSILKQDTDGFYNYSSGENTIYRRIIQIENISITDPADPTYPYDAKRVRCKVYWQSREREFSVENETILTDWR